MDTVILAAGKGSRLNGITAPYMKPLLVVNGRPIVRDAVEKAKISTTGRVTVIAAPENALHISQVLDGAGLGDVEIILQRVPLGPGLALQKGLKYSISEEVLVLMGDNISSVEDIKDILAEPDNVVGVKYVLQDEAERFTWYDIPNSLWVEKVRPEDDGYVPAWVGPLKVNRGEMMSALSHQHVIDGDNKREASIGPALNWLHKTSMTQVSTIDIGVPEELK